MQEFTKKLDRIIASLAVLGRAEPGQSQDSQQVEKEPKEKQRQKQTKQVSNKNSKFKESIVFYCQSLPLEQQDDKVIFELLMKAKYANKDIVYYTLCQIRKFVSHFHCHNFRCKSDLVSYLCEIGRAGVYPEICMTIVGNIVKGLSVSGKATQFAHLNETVNLTYCKTTKINSIQTQIVLPIKTFQIPESFVILEQLVKSYKINKNNLTLSYLFNIYYPLSSTYLLQILKQSNKNDIVKHSQFCLKIAEKYCSSDPSFAVQLSKYLPEQLFNKSKLMLQIIEREQKMINVKCIEQYLSPNQFQITKNLHIMRQIIQNLKRASKSLSLNPKAASKFYLDVLLCVTISMSRQDPLMSYFPEVQQLFTSLILINPKNVGVVILQQLLEGLKNTKININYPGLIVKRSEVIEILFTSPQFLKKIFLYSLGFTETLNIFLNIVIYFQEKDKVKIFQPFFTIFYGLCYSSNQGIALLSKQILQKASKSFAALVIALRFFSKQTQERVKVINQICGKLQQSPDIMLKIQNGKFVNSKKPLKLSEDLIENYLNTILNPNISLQIRQTTIQQFIDCVGRAQKLNKLDEALGFLYQIIKSYGKKQIIDSLEQKIITLYLKLILKLNLTLECAFSIQFLLSILHKIKQQQCKAQIITLIYAKVFQSPFSTQPNTKNWVMMNYPHIQVHPMKLQHQPNFEQKIDTDTENQQKQQVVQKENKFHSFYVDILSSISKNKQIDVNDRLQEQIVNAVTATDIQKISKLSFICKHLKNAHIVTASCKIIIQYCKTNPSAAQVSDDIATFFKVGEIHDFTSITNNLPILLTLLKNKTVSNEQIQSILKLKQDWLSKRDILQFLLSSKSVKLSSLNEYNNLQLLQICTNSSKPNSLDISLRMLTLAFLQKIVSSEFPIHQHSISIVTLCRGLLLQGRLNTCEFAIVINIYSQILRKSLNQQMFHEHTSVSIFQKVITLICNCLNNCQNCYLLAACYSYINDMMNYQNTHENVDKRYCQIIANWQVNLSILSVGLIKQSKNNKNSQILLKQIYTFLYYGCLNNKQLASALINPTQILSLTINLIVPLSQLPVSSNIISLFQSIGRFLHLLAHQVDQFTFKVNKLLRSSSSEIQEKLHFTLMAPLPNIKQYYLTKQNKLHDFSYIKMVIWVMHIWKQETNILENSDFIQPIIQCVIFFKQLNLLVPLLFKSQIAQKLTAGTTQVSDKFKFWNKQAQQIIVQKTIKHKKNSTKSDLSIHLKNVQQGMVFASALFSANNFDNDQIIEDSNQFLKETVQLCMKFVDNTYSIVETQPNSALFDIWTKSLKNIFLNKTCSRFISSLISQGHFETFSKLLTKIQKANNNLTDVSKELTLLGSISCNQSARSLIVKNRLIEHMINMILTMQENKVAKVNYGLVFCVINFFYYISVFKDTNAKIQGDKKILDIWARILSLQQSQVVQERLLQLLINLSTYKHSKAAFMASKDVHKVCMGLISDPQYCLKKKILMLIFNILYKNAAGIKLYKKKQVIQLLKQLKNADQLTQMCDNLLQVLQSED